MSTKAAKIAAKATRIAKEAKEAKLRAFMEAYWTEQAEKRNSFNVVEERRLFDAANAAKAARMAENARLKKKNRQMPPPYVPFTKSLSNPSMAHGSPVVGTNGTKGATLSSPLVLMGSPVRMASPLRVPKAPTHRASLPLLRPKAPKAPQRRSRG
jgi:hypothetical protein